MIKRKKYKPKPSTSGFVYVHEYQISPKKVITKGDKIRIRGERGWFTFISITTNESIDKTWVDCMDKNRRWRSFYVDRIKGTVPKRRNKVIKYDER